MKGQELLDRLKKLTPDQLNEEIRLVTEDDQNIWLTDIEVNQKGDSGYEVGGEIRLIGSE